MAPLCLFYLCAQPICEAIYFLLSLYQQKKNPIYFISYFIDKALENRVNSGHNGCIVKCTLYRLAFDREQ